MKKNIAIALLILLFVSSAGCSVKAEHYNQPIVGNNQNIENPFEADDSDILIMGEIAHGPTAPRVDERDNLLPWIYNGEEVRLDYFVNASGQAKNVGFLVFLDGIPQPYKINKDDASCEYMHIFALEKDNSDLPFSFIFSPVTGKKGDLLKITVTSIYNPRFQPDMDKTSSYGGYHALLSAVFPLSIEADPIIPEKPASKVTGPVELTYEPVTNDLLETLSNTGLRDIDTEIFNHEIFDLIYFDGETVMDNYRVNSSGKLHVTYKICGHSGLEYATTFYINHQPINILEGESIDSFIEKGSVSKIDLEIDLEELGDYNTFYAISVPKNADDFPEGIFEPQKTNSILLYKKGE